MSGDGPATLDEARLEGAALREASISGVRWVTAARVMAEVLAAGSAIALARLIPPAEFGHAAVALGFAAIALGISWLGFGTPLIQMPTITRTEIEVATFLSVTTGLALTLSTALLLSPYLIEPIFGRREAYLLALVSPIFVLSGLGTVPNAMLQRRLAFRRTSQIEILSLAAGPIVAITLAAVFGLNAEALVFGALATAVVAAALTLLAAHPAVPRWRRREARNIAGFGAFSALVGVTGTLYMNIDYMILGARLSPREVGFYWRAYTLGVDYQSKISGIMTRLALPLYSHAGSEEGMRALREKMIRIHTIVLFPVLTTLIAVAPEAVPLIYGQEWTPAVFPTQVLAISGMAAVAAVGTAPLMFAVGKPRQLLYFFFVLLGGYVLVVTGASGYGLRAVVIAVAAYQVTLVVAQFYFLDYRQVGIPLRHSWQAVRPGLVSSAISCAVAYPTARMLASEGASDLVVILAAGALAVAVYALMLRVLFPAGWQELFAFLRAFLGRGRRRAAEASVAAD
jgi:O-antigen/teichoic acid export membrane protein